MVSLKKIALVLSLVSGLHVRASQKDSSYDCWSDQEMLLGTYKVDLEKDLSDIPKMPKQNKQELEQSLMALKQEYLRLQRECHETVRLWSLYRQDFFIVDKTLEFKSSLDAQFIDWLDKYENNLILHIQKLDNELPMIKDRIAETLRKLLGQS